MKELSIEQKAKAYDEAKSRISRAYNSNRCTIGFMNEIFPEFEESEDERIRGEMISYFKQINYDNAHTWNGINLNKFVAWLEKQGKETRWKPSKEEMDVLYGLAYISNQYDEHKEEVITRLYQDLKLEFFNGSSYENMFPTNTSKEDDVRRRSTIQVLEYARSLDTYNQYGKADIDKNIAWLEKQSEQKHDKVEPKFKVGDYIISNNNSEIIYHITGTGINELGNPDYVCEYVGREKEYNNKIYNMRQDKVDANFKLWTIQDAKDGDMLAYVTDEEDLWIMIYWSLYEPYDGHVHYHALLVNDNFSDKGTCCICINDLKPATKEQRDIFFQKMKEAGYEWDAEKKELKKIDNKEYNDEDYGIDGLFHAQIILENTLGKVAGYQSDDGILEHECAISAVKKLYEQKSIEWSEEDEEYLNFVIATMKTLQVKCTENEIKNHSNSQVAPYYAKVINWLKSLKDRVQPKQEWSEEDEKMFRSLHNLIYVVRDCDCDSKEKLEFSDWLESLKSRVQPKQEWSEEDEKCIRLSTDIIDSALRAGFCVQLDRDRCVDWLKSIKGKVQPKQEWSEEDEKMWKSALWHVKNSCGNGGKNSGEFEVYNWLKSIKNYLNKVV